MSSAAGSAAARGSSRDRLIDSTLRLISRQGYEATVVKDIAGSGSAPMGSFYYHFPGGKEQLVAAAMRRGADQVAGTIERALASHDDVAEALAAIPRSFADQFETDGWEEGCPIAATALESIGRSDVLQQAATEAFDKWQALIADRLRGSGLTTEEADHLALSALSLIEGAEMLSRVRRSRGPLDAAAQSLRTLVTAQAAPKPRRTR